MNNILNKIIIPIYYFNYYNTTHNLWYYLFDNLKKENDNFLSDLRNALTNNANGKYI